MRIAGEQVWTINVATPQPIPAVVKNGLNGVPDKILYSFRLCSPFNGGPETWHWSNPESINGAANAPAAYLAERKESIMHELFHPTLQASSGNAAVSQGLGAAGKPGVL
jgi:hypothetical protein